MKRVMIGAFSHETNAFCPAPADRDAFRRRRYWFGEEILERTAGEEHEITGFVDELRDDGDTEIVPSAALSTGPSGPVTAEMYDMALGEFLRCWREKGPFDGVLLNLHGAMVAEGHPDAEGDLLCTLREEIGPDVPVVVTLDLHGNVTPRMARYATSLIPCEEYPHTDCYELGRSAARLLLDTIRGECVPRMAYRYVPYLLPLFPTKSPEIAKYLSEARRMQEEPGVRFARFAHGFFPSNVPGMGMSVMVTTDGDGALAESLADKLAQDIWAGRSTLVRKYTPLDEALLMAREPLDGPLVLADGSDNPGAGGLCDTTHVLRAVLENGVTGACFAVIRDPDCVRQCFSAGEGTTLRLRMGGKSDPRLSGGPVEADVRVVKLCDGKYRNRDEMEKGLHVDMGPTAVVDAAGNLVCLSTERCQVLDAEGFRCCGIEPEKQKILVVKSAVHYRASFGKFAGRMVDLALPGYCAPDPAIFRSLGFELAGDWEQFR